MATKTFEELKQMAIQIRDEKTNKQNTATRIGTQMLEHLNKLEQEYYDKTNINEQFKRVDTQFNDLNSDRINKTTELNISNLYPTKGEGGTNKYTLEGAIAQVPAEYRAIVGLKIIFINNATNKPETWVYNGGTFTTTSDWNYIIDEVYLDEKLQEYSSISMRYNYASEADINIISYEYLEFDEPINLPDGYNKLPYIRNPQGAFIDTGVLPEEDIRIRLAITTTNDISNQGIAGSDNGAFNKVGFNIFINGYNIEGAVNDQIYRVYNAYSPLQFLDLDLSMNGGFLINKTEKAKFSLTTFSSTSSICLFTVNRSNNPLSALCFKGEMKYAKLYKGEQLIRDYVACEKDDGSIGMYDVVNNNFVSSSNDKNFYK